MPPDKRPPANRGRPKTAPIRFISDAASRIARQLYEHLTPDDLVLFIKAANPEDCLVYHVGYLASDTRDPKVHRKARMANALQTVGVATLLQKRVSPAHYLYYLIKRNVTPDFPDAVDDAVRSVRDKQPRHSRTG